MKVLLALLAIVGSSAVALADIQDPPGNDQGPTRKLSRGVANILFCWNEIPNTICMINDREGNEASASYGVIKGFGRMFFRFGAGIYDFSTWPWPTKKGTYRQPYRSNLPWIHGGYEEFPPELGFQTRYRYVRDLTVY
jgi:putative exosortase-associated protein (TIGR04073 family)